LRESRDLSLPSVVVLKRRGTGNSVHLVEAGSKFHYRLVVYPSNPTHIMAAAEKFAREV
jgi:hypothetical protein